MALRSFDGRWRFVSICIAICIHTNCLCKLHKQTVPSIVQSDDVLCKLHKKRLKTLCNLLIDKRVFVVL
nr:MAG TPA: hypothetical protein [Caudoviricetes sp.]